MIVIRIAIDVIAVNATLNGVVAAATIDGVIATGAVEGVAEIRSAAAEVQPEDPTVHAKDV